MNIFVSVNRKDAALDAHCLHLVNKQSWKIIFDNYAAD